MAKRPVHGRHNGGRGGRAIPERRAPVPAAMRAIKPRIYGSTKQVVADAFAEAGGAKMVGVIFDLGPSQVYGFTDPEARGSDLSLDRARRLTEIKAVTAFACDFAHLAGGVFLTPGTLAEGEALADIGGDIAVTMGALVAELMRALADGKLSDAERADLLRRTDAHTATLVGLRARLMDGVDA